MVRKKSIIILLMFLTSILNASAQVLSARAPQQVAVGQQFRLQYTVNTQDVSGFKVGQIPDAFEILMGPSTSSQQSFQIINGKTTQSSSITYTYILLANQEGTFTIPAAQIKADGQLINSQQLKIVVDGQAQSAHSGQQSGGGRSQSQQPSRSTSGNIGANELFIKVTASKKHVVEQEPVLLTYKVYTLVDLTQLDGKMPELKGFHSQEIPLPAQKSFSIEQLNGRNYRTVTWSKFVVFPQMTGKLQIPPITYNGIVVQQNRAIDPFEAFFNGGSSYVEVKKQVQAPGVEIQVDPLPERPAGFSGGVGKFAISASVDKTELTANEPITLKVEVSGAGNLKLIKEPIVDFPKDFDVYDAKISDKTRLTSNGVEGKMIYEYLAVPRHQGQYDIPQIEFTYFDTTEKKYKTVHTQDFHLSVARGDGEATVVQNFTSKEDVKLLAKDIHHIKLGETTLRKPGTLFFGSLWYYITMIVLLLVFVMLFVAFRQRAIENADLMKSRAGKANKVASKRLRIAEKLKNDNKPDSFYDEVLRALWGYVGDKLGIPVEQLSRDNITVKLSDRGIANNTISNFIYAIDECEFVRYAPGDPRGNMQKVYETAMQAIEQIESGMRKKPHHAVKNMVVLLLLLLPLSVLAATKTDADMAYTDGNYNRAIAIYDSLLKEGQSADLYYNLGNAYYRSERNTKAIICYERALALSPGDADIRFNLQMAQSKTVDKIVPESEMFFVTWFRSVVNLASVDGWAVFALLMLGVSIILALVYLFSSSVWLRKIGFFGAIFMILLFISANIFAWQQKQELTARRGAIIISSAVQVKSTPATDGTDLFILHEGTKVVVVDSSMKDWKEIRVSDGKQGWVESERIEMI